MIVVSEQEVSALLPNGVFGDAIEIIGVQMDGGLIVVSSSAVGEEVVEMIIGSQN